MNSFIDLAHISKVLMGKNRYPSVQQELERLSPSTRGGGRGGGGGGVKAESFKKLVQVNHLLLQQLIQILVLQHHLPQNGQLQKYVDKKLVETKETICLIVLQETA